MGNRRPPHNRNDHPTRAREHPRRTITKRQQTTEGIGRLRRTKKQPRSDCLGFARHGSPSTPKRSTGVRHTNGFPPPPTNLVRAGAPRRRGRRRPSAPNVRHLSTRGRSRPGPRTRARTRTGVVGRRRRRNTEGRAGAGTVVHACMHVRSSGGGQVARQRRKKRTTRITTGPNWHSSSGRQTNEQQRDHRSDRHLPNPHERARAHSPTR